ncbi:MAG: hypothetical protein M3020_23340 [Myxococcota bacterium]|nr:hypothetical protein [Myxococcota bacterium]
MRPSSLLAVLLLGCSHGPEPCLGIESCPLNAECLAARCVAAGSPPVDPATRRRSAIPSRMALARDELREDVGPSVVLGAPGEDAALFLRFTPIWRGAPIDAAFLILEPAPRTLTREDVPLEVSRIQGAWEASSEPRKRLSQALPSVRGIGRAFPEGPIRIDVTPIVAYLARHPEEDRGLAVAATREVPPGLAISTGLDGGSPPRLEVYLR